LTSTPLRPFGGKSFSDLRRQLRFPSGVRLHSELKMRGNVPPNRNRQNNRAHEKRDTTPTITATKAQSLVRPRLRCSPKQWRVRAAASDCGRSASTKRETDSRRKGISRR
jgi:hypothetical protein